MNKVVAVTGANGFIGKLLVAKLFEAGYTVKAFVHKIPAQQQQGIQYYLYELAAPIEASLFKEVDILIHLAFQFKPTRVNGVDVNIYAAKEIKALALPYYIFVSSFAAAPPITNSYYGRTKAELETIFSNDLIIRPGLVLGNGGLFEKIKQQLQKNSFVPLLQGGRQTMQTIFIDDLINTIQALIQQKATGLYQLGLEDRITYKQFMYTIARELNKNIFFVPVPVRLLSLVIKLVGIFSSNSFSNDNLNGLLASKYIDTSAEQKSYGTNWLPFEKAIKLISKTRR